VWNWPDGEEWRRMSASEVGAAVRRHAAEARAGGRAIECPAPEEVAGVCVALGQGERA
jgi:hypothetical protein